ncbi:MAG: CHAP domain-containing protein [Candidatus Aenigmatarchaeota archaeon]|nr:MAG: CHAP domain-containing protein [Candidatus Aenigmarchaeota archaeon]
MEIRDRIVKTANSFIGQEEIKGNLGFKDEDFQDMMEAVGWKRTEAWCAFFVELVWKLAFVQDQAKVRELGMIMSGGAVATYNGFKKAGYGISTTPEPGDIVIWQKYKQGKPHWSGHAGIVTEVTPGGFVSVEGNTNDAGGREGYIVAEKKRKLNLTTTSGLRIKGFIKVTDVST